MKLISYSSSTFFVRNDLPYDDNVWGGRASERATETRRRRIVTTVTQRDAGLVAQDTSSRGNTHKPVSETHWTRLTGKRASCLTTALQPPPRRITVAGAETRLRPGCLARGCGPVDWTNKEKTLKENRRRSRKISKRTGEKYQNSRRIRWSISKLLKKIDKDRKTLKRIVEKE